MRNFVTCLALLLLSLTLLVLTLDKARAVGLLGGVGSVGSIGAGGSTGGGTPGGGFAILTESGQPLTTESANVLVTQAHP